MVSSPGTGARQGGGGPNPICRGHKKFSQVEGHRAHFPHPAPGEEVKKMEDEAISETQIDCLKMLLGSLYGLGQVTV